MDASSREPLFWERCYLLTRKNTHGQPNPSGVVPAIDPAAECQMICFLRESERRRQERRALTNGPRWNPFIGAWIVVAKTRRQCLEHSNENDIYRKNGNDYYTIHLGDRWSCSVQQKALKACQPMQELGRQYLESWNNGAQMAFLSRMWESAKAGTGLTMAYHSIRKLFLSSDKDRNSPPKK
ncbi:hypothetical protein BX666DRAFT_836241 [Dichotomocladium elegans]|nr:hypothetical protein BX666DRAFT_836241 [Dichotomocladium elegans]